jgi:hypothetical protein
VGPDGSVTLAGTRTDGQQILEFTQTLRLVNARLSVNYRWRAQTALELRAFRQSVRFSPRVFGGKDMITDTDRVHLPIAIADDATLAKTVTSAMLPIGDRQTLTVRLSQAGHLLDDRYYKGPGYLLAFYPIAGEVKEGHEWSYSIEIVRDRGESARSHDQ